MATYSVVRFDGASVHDGQWVMGERGATLFAVEASYPGEVRGMARDLAKRVVAGGAAIDAGSFCSTLEAVMAWPMLGGRGAVAVVAE